MNLNHYISQTGLCSRRNATVLIKGGQVSINNFVIKDPAYQVKKTDVVRYKKRVIKPEEKIYILLNKPMGYVTTTADELGRKTVLDLISGADKKRLFPIGRLDKETTGLIILTNDGQLSQQLAHPRYEIKKVYHAILDKPLTHEHALQLKKGFRLRDGIIRIDGLSYPDSKNKNVVKVTLHSGKKRIVRRMFEHLEYMVRKLDRTNYAGLTQKGLRVGMWRNLTDEEIQNLRIRS